AVHLALHAEPGRFQEALHGGIQGGLGHGAQAAMLRRVGATSAPILPSAPWGGGVRGSGGNLGIAVVSPTSPRPSPPQGAERGVRLTLPSYWGGFGGLLQREPLLHDRVCRRAARIPRRRFCAGVGRSLRAVAAAAGVVRHDPGADPPASCERSGRAGTRPRPWLHGAAYPAAPRHAPLRRSRFLHGVL